MKCLNERNAKCQNKPKMVIRKHIESINYFQSTKTKLKSQEFQYTLADIIETNINGCEMILTLFIAALNSYKPGSCLKPFPPSFLQNGIENISSLRRLCETIPSLKDFILEPTNYSNEICDLLCWLFFEKAFPLLEEVPFESVLSNNNIEADFKPDYVFKVHHCSKNNLSFQKRIGTKGTIRAFHGSQVFNFFSILKFGLQQHLSSYKETLFGKGIYLSSDLSVSAHFSPYGLTWKNGTLGNRHSVIAVCEIINDLDKVKCKDSKNKNRSINVNSTGEIPEKYFVVTDNEMVQLKYLMVYRKKETVETFFTRNVYWILLVLYFFMLIFIGSRGISWRKIIKFVFGELSIHSIN